MIKRMVNKNYKDMANFKKEKVIFFIDEGLSLYIIFVNLSVLKELSSFIEKNEQLKKITNSELKQMALNYLNIKNNKLDKNKNDKIDKCVEKRNHYFYEDFKFIDYLYALIHSYLENLDINIEKYRSKYMKCDLRYEIHEELKKIYIKKSPIKFTKKEKNIKIIKYEFLFSSKTGEKFFERFNDFEKLFNLSEIICKYITFLSKRFKYEKRKEDDPPEVNTNLPDPNLPPSNYTMSSINIVSSLFHKVGYEVFNLNENLIINDFCFNNCDMTQMAVSFGQQGNIKINLLNNLINKKKNRFIININGKR